MGDQGNPNGSLDAKALYGQPGSGGSGLSPGSGGLEMAGWAFVSKPDAPALDNTSGFVRCAVVGSSGTLHGTDPLAGLTGVPVHPQEQA